jgi:hypothetical protein
MKRDETDPLETASWLEVCTVMAQDMSKNSDVVLVIKMLGYISLVHGTRRVSQCKLRFLLYFGLYHRNTFF